MPVIDDRLLWDLALALMRGDPADGATYTREHLDELERTAAGQGLNLWLEVAGRLKAHMHDRPNVGD